jgi:hypothetical protein
MWTVVIVLSFASEGNSVEDYTKIDNKTSSSNRVQATNLTSGNGCLGLEIGGCATRAGAVILALYYRGSTIKSSLQSAAYSTIER